MARAMAVAARPKTPAAGALLAFQRSMAHYNLEESWGE